MNLTRPRRRACSGMALALIAATLSAAGLDQPFSHQTHAPLKWKCTACHAGAEKADRASFPALAQCRVCHSGMSERTIPSRRVYRVRDYVFFSHARHTANAKVSCQACHGDVYQQASLKVERPTSMKACMDCHREDKATLACNACHELGQ